MSTETPDEAGRGFLSRWSQRKQQVRQGLVVPAEAPVVNPPVTAPATAPARPEAPAEPTEPALPPAPTLADVAQLDTSSDFSRFVARNVGTEVKNAALKKLFSDPHFNVMDGLDIYIDDYGRPDPIPADMLQKLQQSEWLGLRERESEAPHQETLVPASNVADGMDKTPSAESPANNSSIHENQEINPINDQDAAEINMNGKAEATMENPPPAIMDTTRNTPIEDAQENRLPAPTTR